MIKLCREVQAPRATVGLHWYDGSIPGLCELSAAEPSVAVVSLPTAPANDRDG